MNTTDVRESRAEAVVAGDDAASVPVGCCVSSFPGGSALAHEVCAVPPRERTVAHVLRCTQRLAVDDAHAADMISAIANDTAYVSTTVREKLSRLVDADTFAEVMQLADGAATACPATRWPAAGRRKRCPLRALTSCFGRA